MRIAQVIAGPYPAFRGSQVLVAQLVEALRGRGHQVAIVSYGTWLRERPGFHPGRIPLDVALAAALWRTVRRDAVDVIHAHNYEAGGAALLVSRATGVPFVFHGHSAMAEEMPLYARGRAGARLLGGLGRLMDTTIPSRAGACFAVTDALAERLRAAGARRVESLLPLVSLDGVPPLDPRSETTAPTVVYAGNLDAYQNLPELLRAFALVRARVPAARLLLVSHQDARRAGARLRGAGLPAAVEIVHAASYEEVRGWLEGAHVLVLPRCESTGFPMKLLNYMAAGKAIVAAAGSAQGVRDGETARVVPDHDVEGFGRAIAELLTNEAERQRLGSAARALASDPERAVRCVTAVERVYDEVCRV